MSILSESLIQIKNETITLMAVSNSSVSPSIAICTQTRVMLYNDSGEKHDYELARNQQPTAIEWHPSQPTLAIGWQNGTLTLWQEDSRQAKEETSIHKEAINLICYNTSGSRTVTADQNGLVVIWRGITPMSQYQKEGLMTICQFADLNNIIKSQNLFFFGGKAGLVCLADDSKHCSEVCKVVGSIKSLMIYEKENSVIIITSGLLLVQFKISTTEKTLPDKKVKLSIAGDVEWLNSAWIGSCLVAMSSNENMIRMWHLGADENYVMTLHEIQELNSQENILNDKITCVAYSKKSKRLIGGTKEGRIVFWKNNGLQDESPVDSEQWKPLPFLNIGKQVQSIAIGKNNGLIAVRTQDTVKIMQECLVHGRLQENVRILQIGSNTVLIYLKKEKIEQGGKDYDMFQFESKYTIKSIDCTTQFLMIQSVNKIEIHEFQNTQIIQRSTVDKKCVKAAIYQEDLILINENFIEVANFKGVVKQNIAFSESDGFIVNFQMMNKSLVIWTQNNYFRIYDLGRREVRQLGVNRKFENTDGSLGTIRYCSVNNDGSKVAILADNHGNKVDKFFVYDLDLDNFQSFELPEYRNAIDVQWDQNDPRFFGVTTVCTKSKQKEDEEEEEIKDFRSKQLATFFYNSQSGIKEQDNYPLEPSHEGLFAIRIPQIYIIFKLQKENESTFRIVELLMNEFVGLEKADEPTKRAVVNFSYHLSSGNLDEAYKSVKAIQNPAVWEKMAQMSVKTKRLDVAEICIGNMRFARGAKAIRETKKEPEFEAQLAMVAIQLNLIGEAEKLYQQCKRYDLLNQLYQSKGDWTKALEVAEKFDRINLLSTYFKLARQYEISKDFDQAIQYYEKSGNGNKEIPRMFLEADELDRLEQYIHSQKNPSLYKWWGNYMESQEQFDQALKYYRDANDTLGVVRILLHQNNLKHAKEYCNEKGDPSAYYYLAKQLENMNILPEAIQYFAKAQYYSEAVRLAKDQNMISDVMAISLQAPKQVMIQSAIYFEAKSIIDKAVLLYMKGGLLNKALELAQKSNLTEYVKKINQEMALRKDDQNIAPIQDNKKQPQSQQSSSIQQPQKQVNQQPTQRQAAPGSLQDLMNRREFMKALDLCEQQGIQLSDDLVKTMVEQIEENKKKEIQVKIAEICKKMGNFEQASRIYIQLGERVKAMKALCKLGDVEKIIAFANNARMPQIYVLAGNYLQTGDWHKTPELMKHIIQFYNKAKAFDHLAVFFDACSTVEIDEYRDYEKASSALKEAIKHSEKSQNQMKTQQLKQKLVFVEQFVQARNSEPQEMLRRFQELLNNPNIEYAVRQGDIHAEIVEYYYSQKQLEKAFDEIQKMQKKSIVLNPYLDQQLIQNVMNFMKSKGGPVVQQQQLQEDDFKEEDVIDDDI